MVDSPKDTKKPSVTIDAKAEDVTADKIIDVKADDKPAPAKSDEKQNEAKKASKPDVKSQKPVQADKTAEKPVKQNKTSVPKSSAAKDFKSELHKDSAEFGRDSKKPAPQVTQTKQPAAQKSGGFFGRMVAGIFGGIIVLGGAGAAQYLGYIPSAADYNPNYANSSSPTNSATDTKALEEKLAALQAKLDEGGTLDEAVLNAAIDARIATNNSDAAPDNSGLLEKLAALETKLTDSETAISALKLAPATAGDPEALSGLTTKMSEMDEQVSTLGTGLAQQSEALTALKSEFDDAKNNGADKKAARALAAAALKSDIDAGKPFAASLQTLAAVSDDPSGLEGLKPYSEKGVPTLNQLATQFKPLGNSIISASAPAKDTGALSRLIAGAKSLVTVKQIGPVDGDGAAAIVSRISAALSSGDATQASAQWDSLSDGAKELSKNWQQDLSARLTADSLVAKTVKSFMLSGS